VLGGLLCACSAAHLERSVFPDPKHAWLRSGTFPNPDNLRHVAPGVTKDQLYDLLGRPHFGEGFVAVREWNYLFNFRTGHGDEYVTCQYRVVFDGQQVARQFFWKPTGCASQIDATPAALPAPPPAPRALTTRKITLETDALFLFDRSGIENMLPAGRARLDRLAQELHATQSLRQIRVRGYTDRLGAEVHNAALSTARAESVLDYLVAHGVLAEQVQAEGLGSSNAAVACAQTRRAALIDCLQPNRRVEVLVDTQE
jgi:OOP family OmpA-OmpF porin